MSALFLAVLTGLLAASKLPAVLSDHAFLTWNGRAVQNQCPRGAGAVWVTYSGGKDCIRYFSGGTVDDAQRVVVVLRGDREQLMKRPPHRIPANSAAAQAAIADRKARQYKVPIIILARPGTYGSSGNHARRRQPEEYLALNAALDSIRKRHRIKNFVVVGQSGGATAAASLLTLGRRDIQCAVLTSGAFLLLERAEMLRKQNGRRSRPGFDVTGLSSPYDPMDHLAGIVHDRTRQIILIGNPKDQVTPFTLQERFAAALKAAGHNVRLLTHGAKPPKYHALNDDIGLRAAARCARGGVL